MKENHLFLKVIILFIFLILFSTPSLALIPGDFGSAGGGPPDGVVDFEDLMIFAMTYGSTEGDANWNEVCDIASQGSTTPDGVVDFEDLMLFAMHYGECSVHNLTKDTYYNTIQEALDDAGDGNIIEVADGTYDESINFPSGKLIILQSVNGTSSTTVIGDNGSATVTCSNSPEGTTLEGFTITHTEGLTGSGVYIVSSDLTINDCTISGNSAAHGGGIKNYGTLDITSSTIYGNTVYDYGGGIYNYGTLTITSSDISGNSAASGGGIYNYGTLTITSSTTISGNTATFYGGAGIYNNSTGTLTISGSTISNNSATNYGAGICNYGTLTITSSDISNNSATNYGAGICNYGTLTITSSDISGNSAANYGAGICNYGTLTITSSDISGNSAASGGGIYNYGTLTVTSSTISGNDVSLRGGGIYLTGTGTITIGGNDASDTSNFNTFTDNKKDGTVSADQHICNSSGDCRSSYPYNYYNPD